MSTLLIVPQIDDRQVEITKEAGTRRADLIKLASAVMQVNNGEEQQVNVNNQRQIKALIKEAEDLCEVLKGPSYRTYKKVMSMTEEYVKPLKDEIARLKRMNDNYQTLENERVEKENQRIENERRQAEQKLADELAAQAKLQQKAPEKITTAFVRKEMAVEQNVQDATEKLQQVQTTAPAVITRAAGLAVKKVVKFEITDAAALYAARPEWFNLVEKKSVINASITKNTVLPGIKIWEAIETGTRA